MDVLISFYIDGELSEALKTKVEEHLKECPGCKAKFNIISSLFNDFREYGNKCTDKKNSKTESQDDNEVYTTTPHSSKQYRFFKKNLSAYVDNELPEEESIKMKKFTITNKKARKDLEDAFRIRKLMRDSFRKSEMDSRPDFSKSVLKEIDTTDKNELRFNPLIMTAFAFIISVLIISTIVIYMLSAD